MIAVRLGNWTWLSPSGERSDEPVPWPFQEAKEYVDESPGAAVYIIRGCFEMKVWPK